MSKEIIELGLNKPEQTEVDVEREAALQEVSNLISEVEELTGQNINLKPQSIEILARSIQERKQQAKELVDLMVLWAGLLGGGAGATNYLESVLKGEDNPANLAITMTLMAAWAGIGYAAAKYRNWASDREQDKEFKFWIIKNHGTR